MRFLFLIVIKLYWVWVPEPKRRKCIFRESCSNYVFRVSKYKGLYEGLKALYFRYKNCRRGVEAFHNPITGEYQLILPNKTILCQDEIAERLKI